MAIRTELTVRLQNVPGALAKACQVISEERINIVALQLELNGALRMVVDHPLHALASLRERNYQVEQRDVLYTLMPSDAGTLMRVSRMMSEAGVNIEYLYATSTEEQAITAVVIGVPDARRASAAAGI
jgi:hypothetical protein